VQPPGNLTFSTCFLSIFRLWGLSSWSNFPSPGQHFINRNIQQNHIELQNMHVRNKSSIFSSRPKLFQHGHCWWKKKDFLTFIPSFDMNWENCACSAENYSNFSIIQNGGYVKFPHPRTRQYCQIPETRSIIDDQFPGGCTPPPPPPWGLTLIGALSVLRTVCISSCEVFCFVYI
jgi:hypothetical protein